MIEIGSNLSTQNSTYIVVALLCFAVIMCVWMSLAFSRRVIVVDKVDEDDDDGDDGEDSDATIQADEEVAAYMTFGSAPPSTPRTSK